MNYKPFVSNYHDDSINPVYFDRQVHEDGREVFTPTKDKPLRSIGVKSSSFSIHSQINAGVSLRPSPAYANSLDRLDGIDSACAMVDKLSSDTNKKTK